MPLTYSLGSPQRPGSRLAGWVLGTVGVSALLVGVALLALGGVIGWLREWLPAGEGEHQVDLTILPVVRTSAELESLAPGAELLLEGRAQHALFPPDLSLLGAQQGLLTWREERFKQRESGTTDRAHEVWATVDTISPTLAIRLRDTETLVFIGADYRLRDPLTQLQSDTPAVRPSPRAGQQGSWRFTGVRVGERVTVAVRKTTAAVGASLPMRAAELRPGTASEWLAADAEQRDAASGSRRGMLALGGALTIGGIGVLLFGWRLRRRAAELAAAPAA